MGGQFPAGKEANFYRPDPASTVDCLSKWALPVTFAGWEVGNQVITGGARFKSRCNPSSPIYRAYDYYNQFKGRASWDQLAIMEAIEGQEPYFSLISDGYCAVKADGSNQWKAGAPQIHSYITLKASVETIRSQIEELMEIDQ